MPKNVYSRSSRSRAPSTQNRRPPPRRTSRSGGRYGQHGRPPGETRTQSRAPARRHRGRSTSRLPVLIIILAVLAAGIITMIVIANREEPIVYEGLPTRGVRNFDAIPGPPWTIAVDAGHGGSDVGAEGLIREVELTEKTAAYLCALLEADPDFDPVLVREAGVGATVSERVKRINKSRADVMLSIHGNSDNTGEATGFECFPAPPGRRYHYQSFFLADLIAAEMGQAGANLRGDFGVRYIYYDTSGTKFLREASDDTIYEEGSFGLVDGSECPAVLVEQCFITNQADLNAFGTDEGCQRAAQCYYNALCTFLKNPN